LNGGVFEPPRMCRDISAPVSSVAFIPYFGESYFIEGDMLILG
jgi:hypothetical protein